MTFCNMHSDYSSYVRFLTLTRTVSVFTLAQPSKRDPLYTLKTENTQKQYLKGKKLRYAVGLF